MKIQKKQRVPHTVNEADKAMKEPVAERLQIGDSVAVMTIDKFGRPRRAALGEVWQIRSIAYVVKLIGAGDNVPIYYTKATLHAQMARVGYYPQYCRKKKDADYWLCKL